MVCVLRDVRAWALVGAALIFNFIFLYHYHHENSFLGLLSKHGEVAYNVARYNTVKVNPDRKQAILDKNLELDRLVDYAEISHEQYGPPTRYRTLNDTIGYGVVIGLLWKVTNSFLYLDIQILQIILFSLLMFLVYALGIMWFDDRWLAFFIGGVHLSFTPLLKQNILVQRDIWAYYGVILLLYGTTSFLLQKTSIARLSFIGVGVAICQWLRPTLFFAVVGVCGSLLLWVLFSRNDTLRVIKGIAALACLNLLLFWVPFMAYNKVAHGRYFASPAGQMLLEGMGEYENKWGFKCSDEWIGRYLLEKHGVRYGTLEFNDKAKEVFWDAVRQDPFYYLETVVRRLPQFFFPVLAWHHVSEEVDLSWCQSLFDRIKAKLSFAFNSPLRFFHFLLSKYQKIFFLAGYLGLLYALIDRRYLFIILFYLSCTLSSITILLSHVEGRYLIPYYGIFSFFVGYGFWRVGQALVRWVGR